MPQRQPLADTAPAAEPGAVPMFDLQAQYRRLQTEIDRRVAGALAGGAYINGAEIAELEGELARIAGGRHCVACANGTDALMMALMTEGIGPGDAVFVPAFTYVATAGAIRLAGATPVFCDVEANTCNLDAADLERRIARTRARGGPTPRAVVPVDLYGLPADYAAIHAVAEAHGLTVVADAAQSLGARRDGTPAGALAAITTTSFYPTKPLGCAGDGGALFTDDAGRAARWRAMRTHGTDASRAAVHLGMNNRLDTLQAAVLLAKLPGLEAERAHRERLAAIYDAALAGIVDPAPRAPGCESAWALYTIASARRAALQDALAGARIGTAVYYAMPVHLHPAYRHLGEGPGSLPVSERLAGRVLSLPLTAETTPAQVRRVCAVIRQALGG